MALGPRRPKLDNAAVAHASIATLPEPPPRGFPRALWAVAEAIFAGPEGPPPAERLQFVVGDLPDFLRLSGTRLVWVYRLALFAVEWLAPITRGRAPLRYLPWDERVALLQRLEGSVFGLPLFLVKTILCIIYYEHPDAEAELVGDAGGCMGERT